MFHLNMAIYFIKGNQDELQIYLKGGLFHSVV